MKLSIKGYLIGFGIDLRSKRSACCSGNASLRDWVHGRHQFHLPRFPPGPELR